MYRYGKPRAASIRAVANGTLWSLNNTIFTHAVLRTQDMRKNILRTLRKVELLRCLNMVQLQRLVDVMSEQSFKAGDEIITQGQDGDTFYVIVRGSCKVTVRAATDPIDAEGKTVAILGANDYFGERALLNREPRAATVTAVSDVSVLQVGKEGFEDVLGRLSAIIDTDRTTREKTSNQRMQNAPRRFEQIKLLAFISTGQFGSHAMASYNSQSPNLCIKTVLLNGKSNELVKHDVTNALEALQLMAASSVKCNCTVAKLLAIYREPNAFHMVFNNPLVTDLDCLAQKDESNFSKLPYIAASIINALDYLHRIGIVYRSIQPESIHVDINGRIVLIDFEICKVAGVGKKSYTVCGVPDYMAPEQISQQGHNEAVDFWSLGVLLYELACHENPFSGDGASEVQIFSKITSLGADSLPVNPGLPAPLMDIIRKLVIPSPSSRLGVGTDNMAALKNHEFFQSVRFDADFLSLSSPLRNFAVDSRQENFEDTEDLTPVTSKWNELVANSQWADDLLLD